MRFTQTNKQNLDELFPEYDDDSLQLMAVFMAVGCIRCILYYILYIYIIYYIYIII